MATVRVPTLDTDNQVPLETLPTVAPAALLANRTGITHVAHRGGGALASGNFYRGPYPEETLEAFEACLAAGVTALNPHVGMLADGALVLMHDATPDRTTNATGTINVADYSSAAWRKLKVTPANATLWPGYGVDWGEQHPPFFNDYLVRCGDKALHLIECIRRGTQLSGQVAAAVTAMLKVRGLEKTAILSAFSAGELTPAATAGMETMYLPPDYNAAGYDAASIATAMSAGWAAGKPKHVGINSTATAATQAQMVTYIGTLLAAGFTVWAYGMVRRYDVAWLQAAGVTGFIHDEPIYAATTAKVNKGAVDQLSLGVWPHGLLHADLNKGRGDLLNGGFQLSYTTGTTASQHCVYGAYSPPTNLNAYTVQADFVWDVLDSDATRHMDMAVCCPDDRAATFVIGSGNGVMDGYTIIFRQNATSMVVSKASQSAQTLTTLLTQTTGLPPAATAGTVTTMKVQVTSTQLVVSLIQGGTTYGPFTVADTTYRGGYFHLGKAYSSGTKLVGTWKNVSMG